MKNHLKKHRVLYAVGLVLLILLIVGIANFQAIKNYVQHPRVEFTTEGEARVGSEYIVRYNAEGAESCRTPGENGDYAAIDVSGAKSFTFETTGFQPLFLVDCRWSDGFADTGAKFVWVKKEKKNVDPEALPAATEAPIATEAPAVTENPAAALPKGVLPAVGTDLRASAEMNSEILGKAKVSPLEVLGKDSKNPDTADDDWIYVRDGNDLEGWIPMKAVVVNQVELDLSKVPDKDNGQSVIVEDPAVPEQVQIIDFPVPGNYVSLYTEEGKLKGVTYPLQNEGPHVIPVCHKCTLIIGVGKFTMAGTTDIVGFTAFTGLFGASEVTGNIIAGVCTGANGCVYAITGAKAAHIQVTIVFPGYEIPNESAAWAVNFMFNPESSNCGDGCKEVYFGNLNLGAIKKFDKAITAPDLDLVAPEGPYSKINIVVDGTPSGSEDILNDAGDPIGQKYYLADKDAFVSVPEDGGTVFYFGAACTLNGISKKAGDVAVESGIKTDGGTPHDQNQTVEVVCSQPEMVLVHFFHGGDFQFELQKLISEHPDWLWP